MHVTGEGGTLLESTGTALRTRAGAGGFLQPVRRRGDRTTGNSASGTHSAGHLRVPKNREYPIDGAQLLVDPEALRWQLLGDGVPHVDGTSSAVFRGRSRNLWGLPTGPAGGVTRRSPWLLLRHLGLWPAVAAPIVFVVNPSYWSLGPSIGYEALLAWLLSYSLVAAWLVRTRGALNRRGRTALAMTAGLAIALAILTQTKTIVVLPVLAYLLWSASRRSAVWGTVGLALGLVPWMIRNLLVVGSLNPLTHNGPYNLWVGNNPESVNGGSMVVAPLPPDGQTLTTGALQFIVSQPEKWIDLTFSKIARLFEPVFVYPDAPGALRGILHFWAGGLALAIAAGFVFYCGAMLCCSPPRIPAVRSAAAFVALFFVAHVPFIAEPRFMTSVLPVTTSVATAFWLFTLTRLRARGHPHPPG